MTRMHELLNARGEYSRLTITPSRVTVKVAKCHEEMAFVLYTAGRKIAEGIGLEYSLRGCFDVMNRRVTLYSNNRAFKITFDFDGREL